MKLANLVRVAQVDRDLLREAQGAGDWIDSKHRQKKPKTGDPHPKGGVYLYRTTVQGVREALPALLKNGVRLGRVLKLGVRDPGQLWLVEVYKPGANSMTKKKPEDPEDDTWILKPELGVPSALVLHQIGDQLTWTGDVYETFEDALVEHSKGATP